MNAMDAEMARRQRVVNALYREYLATHNADAAMQAGTADLPKEWVDNRLTEMGEHPDRWEWERYRPDV